MATILLSAAGASLGASVGGSVLGLSMSAIGRFAGAMAGSAIDRRTIRTDQHIIGGGSETVHTGQMNRFRLTGAGEGRPIGQVFGRMRVAGQVIWSSEFEERIITTTGTQVSTQTQGAPSGGKGARREIGMTTTTTANTTVTQSYAYTISIAVALCEGEITSVGRIWAEGVEIARGDLTLRVYTGSQDQMPDPKMEAVEGAGMVPAYRGTAYVVLEDLDIVAFVSETQEEIVSGNSAGEISFIESNDYDAAITTAAIPQTGCADELFAEVSLKNYGVINLTSLDFVYSVNGGEEATYSWTGNLAQNESEVVTLPSYEYIPTDANNFDLRSDQPNGVQDELPQNDSYKQMFLGSQTYPENCTFMILVMKNPESVTWSIVDEMGTAITEGGPYTNTAFHIHEFSFPETGCYELIVNDATGTGLDGGLYVIGNEDNDILWTGGNFTYTTSAQLAHGITVDVEEVLTSDDVSIHPNPITNSANIEFSLYDNANVNIAVFDILGKKVMNIHEGQLYGGAHSIKMNSNEMQQGIYFVKIEVERKSQTHKIVLMK